MPDPFTFDSTSPRFDLPFLFVGQAQKEAWVNEAFARIDGLLHSSIEGERADPPASPVDGEAWLVAAGEIGAWAGKDAMIATRQADNWLFIAGREGLRVIRPIDSPRAPVYDDLAIPHGTAGPQRRLGHRCRGTSCSLAADPSAACFWRLSRDIGFAKPSGRR